ncbi:MAG: C40 family peptidase [Mucilaginibacter sp.]|uniref:C40 family peptidase n=1 Tax=Mucilaginibacter sp. TaxID=1882438 RepID=UPI0031B24E22
MHLHVGFKVLVLASLSFMKPERAALVTRHKTKKIVRVHHSHHTTHSLKVIDTAALTGCTTPDELIVFAKTLKGIRYRYGSSNPERGFDCSGFVNYVFNHFGISIPRSSSDFADVQGKRDLNEARFGDLILFTGTKTHNRGRAGHIGIIISQPGEPITFIHSTSGAANGVTETTLNDYYMGRYIKTIRLFPENDDLQDEHLASVADTTQTSKGSL